MYFRSCFSHTITLRVGNCFIFIRLFLHPDSMDTFNI